MGYQVFGNLTEESSIDLVAYKDDEYLRIQIKSVTPEDELLVVPLKSSTYKYRKYYTKNDVDIIAVFDSKNYEVYFIPPDINKTSIKLRLSLPKSGQIQKIHLAENFKNI